MIKEYNQLFSKHYNIYLQTQVTDTRRNSCYFLSVRQTFHIMIVTACIYIILVLTSIVGSSLYENQYGWRHNFQKCSGKLQSPIPISFKTSVSLPLPALEMIGYHDYISDHLVLENDGHSVTVTIDKNSTETSPPYIFGALLQKNINYIFESFHFHWGLKNNKGSEHVLNDIRYPMELHIVHRNEEYKNFSTAVNYDDGLAVLAIFFQLREQDNKLLNPILQELPYVQWETGKIKMKHPITLSSIMPRNTDIYYTYRGSLTTPPCNEAVTWIVFPTPVPISFRQIEQLRAVTNGKKFLANNYRRLQDVGLRKIYLRSLDSIFVGKMSHEDYNYATVDWFWK